MDRINILYGVRISKFETLNRTNRIRLDTSVNETTKRCSCYLFYFVNPLKSLQLSRIVWILGGPVEFSLEALPKWPFQAITRVCLSSPKNIHYVKNFIHSVYSCRLSDFCILVLIFLKWYRGYAIKYVKIHRHVHSESSWFVYSVICSIASHSGRVDIPR